jgi:hypothetical protein
MKATRVRYNANRRLARGSLPPMNTTSAHDLHHIDGKIVLVKSSRDHRNPQAAIRGTIVVHENNGGSPDVSIEFDVPQMFRKTAHHRTLHLDYPDVMRLLESEYNGVFDYTTDEVLD